MEVPARGPASLRDARVLLATGISLFVVGLLLAPWGFLILSDLPRLDESSDALGGQAGSAGEPLPGILPSTAPLVAQSRVIAMALIVLAVGCIAVGAVVALLFGRAAFGDRRPR
jgi:hypothetical protein